MAWLGAARLGLAGTARQGMARHVAARHGMAWPEVARGSWETVTSRGAARCVTRREAIMVFRFKPGARLKGDAQAVGEALAALEERDGELTPEVVEREARKKSSPLHDLFEWDDSEAAYKYRLGQAAHVIRCVVVIDTPETPPMTAYVRVDVRPEVEDGDLDKDEEPPPARSSYRSTAVVMSDAELRAQVLDRALNELRAFQKKYRNLSELAGVFEAIDKAAALEDLVSA